MTIETIIIGIIGISAAIYLLRRGLKDFADGKKECSSSFCICRGRQCYREDK